MQRPLITMLLPVLLLTVLSGPVFSKNLSFEYQDTRFDIHWLSTFSAEQERKLQRWIKHAARSLHQLNGSLPRKNIRIEIQATASSKAVPFAQVIRERPQGVRFYVNPNRPLSEFKQDWTAIHELVHLYIPHPGQADVWLSEGLATYYQYLLQARAGTITEQAAWQNIYEGFERGRKDQKRPEENLREVSAELRASRSFMRVYWTGTLFFLEVDLRLRKQSQGRVTLDNTLKRFQECCRPDRVFWYGKGLIRALDKASNSTVFSDLYPKYQATQAMPDYMSLFAQLGITHNSGKISLEQTQRPAIRLRQALTAKRT